MPSSSVIAVRLIFSFHSTKRRAYSISLSTCTSSSGISSCLLPFTYDAEGNFESYYERIKEVCDKWDVSYLDLYAKNNSNTGVNVRDDDMRKLYFGTESKPDGDGTHPNELGYQAIYVEPMIPWLKSL